MTILFNDSGRPGILIYENLVRGAGLGHILACYNYGLKLSMKHNLEYLPRKMIAGHDLGRNGELEAFLGLPIFENQIERLLKSNSSLVKKIRDASEIKLECKDTVYIFEYEAKKWNPSDEDFSSTQSYFYDRYWRARQARSHSFVFPSEAVNIAVHIRRGDIVRSKNPAITNRIISDSWYSDSIEMLRRVFLNDTQKIKIRLFSEGDGTGQYLDEKGMAKDPFKIFPFIDEAYIDECPYKTFDSLVDSDIVLGSRSGFFQMAALFSDAIMLIPWNFRALKGVRSKYNFVVKEKPVFSEIDFLKLIAKSSQRFETKPLV